MRHCIVSRETSVGVPSNPHKHWDLCEEGRTLRVRCAFVAAVRARALGPRSRLIGAPRSPLSPRLRSWTETSHHRPQAHELT